MSLTTSSGRASCRSILLTTTTAGSLASKAFLKTKRVCGSGPSAASTRSITPSTIFKTRSTSPPKSAWPGVSSMFIFTPPKCTDVFFAMIVMPRSRSKSIESITRSTCCSFSRQVPDWLSIESTSVVLPWSTCAMIATLRTSSLSLCIPYKPLRAARTRLHAKVRAPPPVYYFGPKLKGNCTPAARRLSPADAPQHARLAQSLVEHDADGGGEVQAAHARVRHGDGEATLPVRAQQFFGQAARLGAEDEAVFIGERPIGVRRLR